MKVHSSPKISVVIPVFNQEEYLGECLESLLDQSFTEWEAVLVLNGVTDESESIAETFKFDDRFKIFRLGEPNKIAAFNFGVERASGQYLVFLAGDDILPPDSLAIRFSYAEEFPGSVHVFRMSMFTDDVTRTFKVSRANFCGGAFISASCLISKYFPVPGSLPNEDTYLRACLLLNDVDMLKHSEIVLNYRVHKGNSSAFGSGLFEKIVAYRQRGVAYWLLLESGEYPDKEGLLRSFFTLRRGGNVGHILNAALSPEIPVRTKFKGLLYLFLYKIYSEISRIKFAVR